MAALLAAESAEPEMCKPELTDDEDEPVLAVAVLNTARLLYQAKGTSQPNRVWLDIILRSIKERQMAVFNDFAMAGRLDDLV